MEVSMDKKKSKKKIRFKGVIIILLCLYLIGSIVYYFFTMPVKNIIVKNNNLVTESQIVLASNISEKTSIFKVNSSSLKKKIKSELPLVHNIKVKKSLFGNVTIIVEENKILFYNTLTSKLVLSDGTEIDEENKYFGYPTLINYVPSDILEKFVKGLSKIDSDIIAMISEIEYNPDRYNDIVIDDERFFLRMNDGNIVHINIVNIEKLNKYQMILTAVGSDGVLLLDSNSKNYIFETKDKAIVTEEKEDKKSEN